MITDKEKKIILKIAKKYNVSKIMLFGSGLDNTIESNDIDIAVEGIPNKDFYSFYGELIFALSKPIDVIDMSIKSKFIDLIRKEGILLDA